MNPTLFVAIAALVLPGGAVASALHVLPAPAGPAIAVATSAIREAGHPCPRVVGAKRLGDGGIRALCSNGETYRISKLREIPDTVAMKCSAATAMGIYGC